MSAVLKQDQETPRQKIIVNDDSQFSMLMDSARFVQITRVGQWLSESTVIPELFQGNPANCGVAVALSIRLQMDVLMLMPKMYVVYGKPGIEAQMKIALVNTRGPFDGPIDWKIEGEGKSRKWTAFAKMKNSNRIVEFTVDWDMVRAEGWDTKKGSKWTTMPDKMGRYRSASYLIDLYCPEVVMGLATIDELQDMERQIEGERVVEEKPAIKMPKAKEKTIVAEPAIDQTTGEIQDTPISDADVTSGNVEPINDKANQEIEQPTDEQNKPAQKNIDYATDSMIRVIKTKMTNAALSEMDLKAKFNFGFDSIPKDKANDVIKWTENPIG